MYIYSVCVCLYNYYITPGKYVACSLVYFLINKTKEYIKFLMNAYSAMHILVGERNILKQNAN